MDADPALTLPPREEGQGEGVRAWDDFCLDSLSAVRHMVHLRPYAPPGWPAIQEAVALSSALCEAIPGGRRALSGSAPDRRGRGSSCTVTHDALFWRFSYGPDGYPDGFA
jgi:hypothetical protein